MTIISAVKIKGQSFDVGVDADGMFHIELDDQTVSAPTLAEVKKLASAAVLKPPGKPVVAIRVAHEDAGRLGTLYGRHTNGNLLVKWDDGGKNQIDSWSCKRFIDASEVTVSELKRLESDRLEAYNRLSNFKRDHRLDLMVLYEQAISGEASK